MIRFSHPEYLYFLLLLPLFYVFYLFFRRIKQGAMKRFGNPLVLERVSGKSSRLKLFWKYTIVVVALGVLIVGVSNPQIGTRLEEVKLEGVDIFIALDVSNSMKAEDITPNRLERARLEIRNLIGRLTGDRIGLIVFAGEAYTQFPLTTDYAAAELFIDAVDTDIVPVQGTAIGKAIEQAMKSFDLEEPTTRVLIIITDGENTGGEVLEAAEEAAEKGILLYAIGMGSSSGAPIPVYAGDGGLVDFKRNRRGEVVMSRLNRAYLEKLVSFGEGEYYQSTTSQDELNEIYDSINSLEKREFGTKQYTEYESRYQYFVVAALLLLLLEIFISERRTVWLAKRLGTE